MLSFRKRVLSLSRCQMLTQRKIKLPAEFRNRYKRQQLNDDIADEGLWSMIPAVNANSRASILKRLKQNEILFDFIDEHMPHLEYAFEPIMQDGRFVCLPRNPQQQGFGLCASLKYPG